MWWVLAGRWEGLRRAGRRTSITLLLALMASGAGCGDDSSELRRPRADQTSSTTSTTSASDPGSVADGSGGDTGDVAPAGPLELSSPAFAEGQPIPGEYTCLGDDVSPPLAWANVPAGTAELALVVRDPDADGFIHWVVSGLPPTNGGVAQGNPPAAAVEALNDFGRAGWSGPCPPSGVHRYDFRLYALPQASGIAPGSDGVQAAEQIESAAAVASAALNGTATAP
jgi:hypothetical protein